MSQSINRECRIWANLDHVNVTKLDGFALIEGLPALVSCWMENGTVTQYVKKNRDVGVYEMVRSPSLRRARYQSKTLHRHEVLQTGSRTFTT
jgi:hypothetical protein